MYGFPNWVLCEEKLPSEEGSYIINWKGNVFQADFLIYGMIWTDGYVLEFENVSHWMELPNPIK